jgi:hypothetical protein
MRVGSRAVIVLLGLTCLPLTACVTAGATQTRGRGPPSTAALKLVGAWRLEAIEYRGPNGETLDPFYQAGSSGIIIYDPSGWMSVQIVAPNRRGVEAPPLRVPRDAGGDAALKAEAFDTYYSYYGTWDFDIATSVVTHHVKSSLITAESGLSYAQTVLLDGGRLIFTVRSGAPGRETLRRKIWERVTGGAP